MKRALRWLGAIALVACAPFTRAAAQAPRPMSIVDMIDIPSLGDPQLSPDGRQLLYTLNTADWKANRRVSHVWRVNADGSGTVQLTSGARGESSPRWSPDGSQIAFVATRTDTGQAQVYLISNTGGEARQLTNHATGVSSITWSPSGDAIYFLASDPKTDEEKQKDRAKDDVYAFDENYKQRHLWNVTVPGGAEQASPKATTRCRPTRFPGMAVASPFTERPRRCSAPRRMVTCG